MATYKQLQAWVKEHYGFAPKTCWIAHVKEKEGLAPRRAPNRKGVERVYPCPEDKIEPIKSALKHFGMLQGS